MLRANRIIPRLCQRSFNFRNEEVQLPGMKAEIELSEEMRKIEKALLEGAKDSPELLKEVRRIYNPYKALNIPQTATQQEIKETIELRKRQYKSQIEDAQKRLPASSTESAVISTSDQILKLEDSLAKLEEVERLLGSIQSRRKFDQEYALQVHQVIWNDLSRGEKSTDQLLTFFSATIRLQTALKIKDNLPPALANRLEDQLVTAKQQKLVVTSRFGSKSARMTFWQFGYLFLFGCYFICRLDEMCYEDKCWHQAVYVYGDNPARFERCKRQLYFIALCWNQGFWDHMVYRYFIPREMKDSVVDSFAESVRVKEELESLSQKAKINDGKKTKEYFLN